MYTMPVILAISAKELLKHIQISARSMCDQNSADYTVGAGCGHLYTEGGCTLAHNCDAAHY